MIASKTDSENDILVYYRKKRNEGKHHYAEFLQNARVFKSICNQLPQAFYLLHTFDLTHYIQYF